MSTLSDKTYWCSHIAWKILMALFYDTYSIDSTIDSLRKSEIQIPEASANTHLEAVLRQLDNAQLRAVIFSKKDNYSIKGYAPELIIGGGKDNQYACKLVVRFDPRVAWLFNPKEPNTYPLVRILIEQEEELDRKLVVPFETALETVQRFVHQGKIELEHWCFGNTHPNSMKKAQMDIATWMNSTRDTRN